MIYHLDNDQLSATPHLAGFALPDTSSSSVHARPQSSDDPPHHDLCKSIRSSLDDRAD
jgi:hypothetical protein